MADSMRLVLFRNANIDAARVGSREPQMDAAAWKVEKVVDGVTLSHWVEGELWRHTSVKDEYVKGVRHKLIENDDPAVLSIEFGHLNAYYKNTDPDPDAAPELDLPGYKVDGIHFMARALGIARGISL